MRCLLTICCESAVVDQINNRLSIFNVIDELTVQQFPAVFAKVTLVFLVEREEGDEQQFEARLAISHSGNEIVTSPISANFADRPRLRMIPVIQGFVIAAPGVYRVAFWHGDRELGYWEFTVTPGQAPQVINASASPSVSVSPSASQSPSSSASPSS